MTRLSPIDRIINITIIIFISILSGFVIKFTLVDLPLRCIYTFYPCNKDFALIQDKYTLITPLKDLEYDYKYDNAQFEVTLQHNDNPNAYLNGYVHYTYGLFGYYTNLGTIYFIENTDKCDNQIPIFQSIINACILLITGSIIYIVGGIIFISTLIAIPCIILIIISTPFIVGYAMFKLLV